MAQNEILLKLRGTSDFSDIQSDVKTLQKYFSGLKLPKGITKNLEQSLEGLDKELVTFQQHMSSGFKTKGDITGLEKSGQRIIQTFEKIQKTINSLDTGDLKTMFSSEFNQLKEIEGKISVLGKSIKKNFSGKINIGADKVDKQIVDIQEALNTLYKTSTTKKFKLLQNAVDAGDIQQIRAVIKELRDYEKTSLQARVNNEGIVTREAKSNLTAFHNALETVDIIIKKIGQNPQFKMQLQDMEALKQQAAQLGITLDQKVLDVLEEMRGAVGNLPKTFEDVNRSILGTAQSQQQLNSELSQVKEHITQFFSLINVAQLLRRAFQDVYNTVKELDEVMTETAVVTDFSISDMWDKLPEYTAQAKALGVATKDLYAATTLYYQQGLDTNAAMAAGVETMKMARIAGMEATQATDAMTAALRGFNMEVNEMNAQNVNDVYSKLAAITASDTEEIATAMSKTAAIANSVGAEFENIAVFLAQGIETTRESADAIGTAMKTILARFNEMKKDPLEIGEIDGEIVDANKVETALRSVGIALRDTNGEFRNADQVLLEVAEKWDSMSIMQQRYIATTAAGSRQQSRFIAFMQDYNRTLELQEAAYNADGAAQQQYEKTLESLDAKIARLKDTWDEFILGIANNNGIKIGIDALSTVLDIINKLTNSSNSFTSGMMKIFVAFNLFKGVKAIFNYFISQVSQTFYQAGHEAGTEFKNGLESGLSKLKKTAPIFGTISKQIKEVSKNINIFSKKGKIDLDNFAQSLKDVNVEVRKIATEGLGDQIFGALTSQMPEEYLSEEGREWARNLINEFVSKLNSGTEIDTALNTFKSKIKEKLGEEINIQIDVDDIVKNLNTKNFEKKIQGISMGLSTVGMSLSGIGNELASLDGPISDVGDGLAVVGETATTAGMTLSALSSAAKALGISLSTGPLVIITLIVSAISLAIGAFQRYQKAQQELIQAQIDAGEAAKEQLESLEALKKSINEINSAYEDGTLTLFNWRTAMRDIIKEHNLEISALDQQTKNQKELNEEIAKGIRLKQEQEFKKLYGGLSAAGEDFVKGEGSDNTLTVYKNRTGSAVGPKGAQVGVYEGFDSIYSSEFISTMSQWSPSESSSNLGEIEFETTKEMALAMEAVLDEIIRLEGERSKNEAAGIDNTMVDAALKYLQDFYNTNKENYDSYLQYADQLPAQIISLIDSYNATEGISLNEISSSEQLEEYKTILTKYLTSLGVEQDKIVDYIESYLNSVDSFSNTLAGIEFEDKYGVNSDYYKNFFASKEEEFKKAYNDFIQELKEKNEYQYFIKIVPLIDTDSTIDEIKEFVERNKKVLEAQIGLQKLEATYAVQVQLVAEGGNISEIDNEIFSAFESSLAGMEAFENFVLSSGITLWGNTAEEQWEVLKNNGSYLEQMLFLIEVSEKHGNIVKDAAANQVQAINESIEALKTEKQELIDLGEEEYYSKLLNDQDKKTYEAKNLEIDAIKDEINFKKWLEDTTPYGPQPEGYKPPLISMSDPSYLQAAKDYGFNPVRNNVIDPYGVASQSIEELENRLAEAEQAKEDFLNGAVGEGKNTFNEEIDEIEQEIKSLESQIDSFDEVIKIELQGVDAIQDTAETIVETLKGVRDVTKMIGKDFTVAADDVGTLRKVFPELLEDATVMADGTVQLNEKIVESYITSDDAIIKSKAEEKIKELELTNTSLKGYITAIEAQMAIYDAYILYRQGADEATAMNFADWLKANETQFGLSADTQATISGALNYEKQKNEKETSQESQNTSEKMAAESASAANSSIANSDAVETAWVQGWNNMGQTATNYFKTVASNGEVAYSSGTPTVSAQTTNTFSEFTSPVGTEDPEFIGPPPPTTFDSSEYLSDFDGGKDIVGTDGSYDDWDKAVEARNQMAAIVDSIYDDIGTNEGLIIEIQSLLNDNANIGQGNSGGSNSSSSGSENDFDYDKYYNIIKQIEAFQIARNLLEDEYQKELEKEIPDLNKLLNIQKQRLEIIEEELKLQKELREGRISQMEELEQSNPDFSKALWYDEESGILRMDEAEMEKIKNGSAENAEAFEEYQSQMEEWFGDVVSIDSEIVDLEEEKNELTEKGNINLDKSFNTLEKIEKSAENLKRIEEEINSILSQAVVNGGKLSEAYDKQIENLQEQKTLWEDILRQRQEQYDNLINSEVGQSYLNSGFIQEIEEGVFEINWDLLGEEDQDIIDAVVTFADRANEASENLDEATENVAEFDQQLRDAYKDHLTNATSLTQEVRDILQESYQKQIDAMQEVNDTMNDSASKIMDSIQKSIDEQRQDRENSKTEEDISDMEARLAYLRQDTSGANQTEILSLEEQLSEAKEDYTDTLIDQKISALQEQNDKAFEQRQLQIDIAQKQLDAYVGSGGINEAVNSLITNGIKEGEIIPGSPLDNLLNSQTTSLSALEKMEFWNDIKEKVGSIALIQKGIPPQIAYGTDAIIDGEEIAGGLVADAATAAGLSVEEHDELLDLTGNVASKEEQVRTLLSDLGLSTEDIDGLLSKWKLLEDDYTNLKTQLEGVGLTDSQINEFVKEMLGGADNETLTNLLQSYGLSDEQISSLMGGGEGATNLKDLLVSYGMSEEQIGQFMTSLFSGEGTDNLSSLLQSYGLSDEQISKILGSDGASSNLAGLLKNYGLSEEQISEFVKALVGGADNGTLTDLLQSYGLSDEQISSLMGGGEGATSLKDLLVSYGMSEEQIGQFMTSLFSGESDNNLKTLLQNYGLSDEQISKILGSDGQATNLNSLLQSYGLSEEQISEFMTKLFSGEGTDNLSSLLQSYGLSDDQIEKILGENGEGTGLQGLLQSYGMSDEQISEFTKALVGGEGTDSLTSLLQSYGLSDDQIEKILGESGEGTGLQGLLKTYGMSDEQISEFTKALVSGEGTDNLTSLLQSYGLSDEQISKILGSEGQATDLNSLLQSYGLSETQISEFIKALFGGEGKDTLNTLLQSYGLSDEQIKKILGTEGEATNLQGLLKSYGLSEAQISEFVTKLIGGESKETLTDLLKSYGLSDEAVKAVLGGESSPYKTISDAISGLKTDLGAMGIPEDKIDDIIDGLAAVTDAETSLETYLSGLGLDEELSKILEALYRSTYNLQGYKYETQSDGSILATNTETGAQIRIRGMAYDATTGSLTRKKGEDISFEKVGRSYDFTAADARIALRISSKVYNEDDRKWIEENRGKDFNPYTAYDIDGDGAVQARDARKILRAAARLENPDVSYDEMIDAWNQYKDDAAAWKNYCRNHNIAYKTGGLADFTGPAWLDGTKSKPELVLNQRDTQNFLQLKDILSSVMKNANSIHDNEKNGDTYYEIHIEVDKLTNDYDVDDVARRVQQIIVTDANYRNVNLINRLR